jgi:hypothetical protein
VRFDLRQAVVALCLAGAAGAMLFLPAVFWIGNLLAPSHPVPSTTHVPPLLGEALWARANGGRATALQPLNPITIGRMLGCHVLAERIDDPSERDREHDECKTLLPAVEAVGYLATVHMRGEGVWQDPRVPFVQMATIARVTSRWTKAELVDTLAARGEFTAAFIGAEHAARGLFGRSPADLTVPQAALVAAVLGNRRADPWCEAAAAATMRNRILERMRNNGAIDEAALQAALASALGLGPPLPNRPGCRG